MFRDDISSFIDALLGLCERDPDAPAYTESTLETKIQRSHRKDPGFFAKLTGDCSEPLAESEVRCLFAQAKLTPNQQEVMYLRIEGRSLEEIGTIRGHSRQGAASVLRQAVRKLVRAFRNYQYLGLSEVYRTEVRRGKPVDSKKGAKIAGGAWSRAA